MAQHDPQTTTGTNANDDALKTSEIAVKGKGDGDVVLEDEAESSSRAAG